jgi:hypothetical protein
MVRQDTAGAGRRGGMRAVLMTAVGGPDVLKPADAGEPEIAGPHDVRVRLRAAGINPVDYKLRAGGLTTLRCSAARGESSQPGTVRISAHTVPSTTPSAVCHQGRSAPIGPRPSEL